MNVDTDEKRNNIINLIKNNNTTEFRKYIKINNIVLKEINNNSFDIFIYAIEQNASSDILKYIINQCRYSNYNYYITVDNKKITPLYVAIKKGNFDLANYLLEKKADIHFSKINIIENLYLQSCLTKENLRYFLKNNSNINMKSITPQLLFKFILFSNNDFLEMILNHFIFSNEFILTFLKIYSTQEPLSNEKLQELLIEECSKIEIKEEWYEQADINNDNETLRILLKYANIYRDKYSINLRISKYNFLKKAIIDNNSSFVKYVLKLQPFSIKHKHCDEYLKEANKHDNKKYDDNNVILLLVKSLLNSILNNNQLMYDYSYYNFIINKIIKLGNFELLQYLIEDENDEYKCIDLNEYDINGDLPLFVSFYEDNEEIFRYLLKQNADGNRKNKNNQSLLSLIISEKKAEYLSCLLNYKIDINNEDDNNYHPLMLAIKQDALDIVILLMKYSQDNDIDMNITDSTDTPLTLSYKLNRKKIFDVLVNYLDVNKLDYEGNNVLFYAIENQDEENIKYLINQGVNIYSYNKNDISCIDYAISKGSEVFNLLLKNCYDSIDVNYQNKQGKTPLRTILCSNGYSKEEKNEIVMNLVARGSDVNIIDNNKKTPLIYAIQNKYLDIIRILIKNGANVNYINSKNNKSILMYAVDSNDINIVKLIVDNHADVNYIKKNSCCTVLGETLKDIRNIEGSIVWYIVPKMNIKIVTGNMIYKIIKNDKLSILKTLINNNLDINIKDDKGYTPLARAISFEKKNITKYLISLEGIDYSSINNKNESIERLNEDHFANKEYYSSEYKYIKEQISLYKKN